MASWMSAKTPLDVGSEYTTVDGDLIEGSPQKKSRRILKAPNFATPAAMVTFYIGEEGKEEEFIVHKEFVCAYSPILKSAFNSNFIEGQTQTYRLDDVPSDAFRMLVKWFYTQKIEAFDFADIDHQSSDWENRGSLAEEHNLNLVHLWILADKLLIPRLQNMAVVEIQACRQRNGFATTKWFRLVYEHTSVDNPLRHLVVDSCLYEYDFRSEVGSHIVDQRPDDFPPQLLLDIFKEVTGAIRTAVEPTPGGPDLPFPQYICERTWRSHLVEE